jgi:D-beta-D-heptose 7-phosphate kinase/D-beta-D-heptose 1-phosphate adenosyltransferase
VIRRGGMPKKPLIVMVSGGYDPVHVGHIHQFKEAKALGDRLVVVLNSDEWLRKKRGYLFMPYEERKEILESIRYVDEVVPCIDEDNTVTKTMEKLRPDIFAKGGDRTPDNMPKTEIQTCEKLGIKIVYGVGGEKIQSSSWLLDAIRKRK